MAVKGEHIAKLGRLGLTIPQMEAVLEILAEATSKSKKRADKPAGLLDGLMAEDFEQWYFVYPRKEKPAKAREAYAKARTKTDAATLLEGAKAYAKRRAGENPQYTLLPASWLGAESWNDQPAIGVANETNRGTANSAGANQRMGGYGTAFDILGKR